MKNKFDEFSFVIEAVTSESEAAKDSKNANNNNQKQHIESVLESMALEQQQVSDMMFEPLEGGPFEIVIKVSCPESGEVMEFTESTDEELNFLNKINQIYYH